jgi:hypothetical protein
LLSISVSIDALIVAAARAQTAPDASQDGAREHYVARRRSSETPRTANHARWKLGGEACFGPSAHLPATALEQPRLLHDNST